MTCSHSIIPFVVVGNFKSVQASWRGVYKIYPTYGVFSAVLKDGTVVTWGDSSYGGDSRSEQAVFRGVEKIHSTSCAFAAVLKDGTSMTWGYSSASGNSRRL